MKQRKIMIVAVASLAFLLQSAEEASAKRRWRCRKVRCCPPVVCVHHAEKTADQAAEADKPKASYEATCMIYTSDNPMDVAVACSAVGGDLPSACAAARERAEACLDDPDDCEDCYTNPDGVGGSIIFYSFYPSGCPMPSRSAASTACVWKCRGAAYCCDGTVIRHQVTNPHCLTARRRLRSALKVLAVLQGKTIRCFSPTCCRFVRA